MVQITFISPSGLSQRIEAEIGESLMQAAVRDRVEGIEAACGGSMVCGTCHVYLDEKTFGAVGPADGAEQDMLEFGVGVEPTSRLCCQIEVTDLLEGAVVRVPESQG
tara:strand:+ start:4912 stop:5232 length:321 start_codon:yes stop_codon:yes gene_type:complete